MTQTPVDETAAAIGSQPVVPHAGPIFPRSSWVALVVMAALVAGTGGYAWGSARNAVRVEEATCYSTKVQIGCTLPDDWTVDVPVDVRWTDGSTLFEGRRAPCLSPRGETERVRLAWVPVSVDGRGTREVVQVYC